MNTLTLVFLLPLLSVLAILCGTPARRSAQIGTLLQLLVTLLIASSYLVDTLGTPNNWRYLSTTPVLTLGEDAQGNPLGIALALGVNGLSVVMLLLTSFVSVAAVWMDQKTLGQTGRQIGTLLISAGAAGAFVSTDLFFFFAFHELALIPTLLLIAQQGKDLKEPNDRLKTAWLTTLYLGAGSLVLLTAILATVSFLTPKGQAWDFSLLHLQALAQTSLEQNSQIARIAGGLFLLGCGILVSLFPFHSWAAKAYASAPAPTAMMHAGVLKKFGIYGLLQVGFVLLPQGLAHWQPLLLVLLLGNVLLIGLVTLKQRRLDSLFGHASVMHMGYLFLAFAALLSLQDPLARDTAFTGATILAFAHGISIALSFGLLSSIESRTGTLEIAKLGGLAKRAPQLCLLFAIALFAGLGLPGLGNFTGEFTIFLAAFSGLKQSLLQQGSLSALEWTTILAILGVLLSALYSLRAFKRTFYEGTAAITGPPSTLEKHEFIPATLLALLLILVGVFPQILTQFFLG